MKLALIGGGLLAVLVGLGFVCPQLQNLRISGSLDAGQAALLAFGIAISAAGGIIGFRAASSLLMRKHAS